MTDRELAIQLIDAGVLTREQAQSAARMRTSEKRLAAVLVDLGWSSPDDIARCQTASDSTANGVSTTETSSQNGTPTQNAISEIIIAENAGGEIIVLEPGVSEAEILEVEIAEETSNAAASSTRSIGLGFDAPPALESAEVRLEGEEEVIEDPAMGTTVRVCNEILLKAVQLGASDVHLEPRPNGFLPRFRVDGHLRAAAVLPRAMQAPIVSRLKVMANLNITETRLSQDGRFRATVGGHRLDFRVSTLPGIHGEKIVMRLLDHSSLVTDLTQLGFSVEAHAQFEEMLRRAHGMILVTGPTGSGKSTTLYAALASTLDESKNVTTVEDPVEYELEGVMQCHVHAEIGNTFAARLRSILRQDPDVILVGEIRDSETADIAVRAALTGHLVLSTLHTNSAVASVARLQDMGVAPFLIASSLSGVVAQRLVRLICRHCRQEVPRDSPQYELAVAELKLKEGISIYEGAGCESCHGTGYRGRVAIMELLNVDKNVRRAITERCDTDRLHAVAMEQGMRTLYQDGLQKLTDGLTTSQELARVLLGNEEIEML